MHLCCNPHPMTVETQHWVMMPEGPLEDPNTKFVIQAVYAPTAEEAVEQVRKMYRIGEYLEPVEPANIDQIRLATGEELPWNSGTHDVFIVGKNGKERTVSGLDMETILDVYGKECSVRKASPEEAESIIRENTCERDKEDEEQFNYGFNVQYKMDLEDGLYDR